MADEVHMIGGSLLSNTHCPLTQRPLAAIRGPVVDLRNCVYEAAAVHAYLDTHGGVDAPSPFPAVAARLTRAELLCGKWAVRAAAAAAAAAPPAEGRKSRRRGEGGGQAEEAVIDLTAEEEAPAAKRSRRFGGGASAAASDDASVLEEAGGCRCSDKRTCSHTRRQAAAGWWARVGGAAGGPLRSIRVDSPTDAEFASLCDLLAKPDNALEAVSFADCGGERAVRLARALATNTGLRKLALISCGLEGGADVIALADALKVNKTLLVLDLRNSSLQERALHALADALRNHNTTLETLQLSSGWKRGGATSALKSAAGRRVVYGDADSSHPF